MESVNESVLELLIEAQRKIRNLEESLAGLEAEPQVTGPFWGHFRGVRTIKGVANFFHFYNLEGVGHFHEEILSKVGNGKITLNSECRALLFEATSVTVETITSLAETGSEGDEDYTDLIRRLRDESRRGEKVTRKVSVKEVYVQESMESSFSMEHSKTETFSGGIGSKFTAGRGDERDYENLEQGEGGRGVNRDGFHGKDRALTSGERLDGFPLSIMDIIERVRGL